MLGIWTEGNGGLYMVEDIMVVRIQNANYPRTDTNIASTTEIYMKFRCVLCVCCM